jgi:uncharacterized protein
MNEAEQAAFLERLRRSGIRVDREGRFVHEEGGVTGEVTHEGFKRALFRWLDRLPPPDGRYILRLDERRFAYLDVDDTPLVARAARVDAAGRVWLSLSDGAEEPLDPRTLTVDAQGTLRAGVRGGRIEARLASSALAALADLLIETPDGQPTFRTADGLMPLRRR